MGKLEKIRELLVHHEVIIDMLIQMDEEIVTLELRNDENAAARLDESVDAVIEKLKTFKTLYNEQRK